MYDERTEWQKGHKRRFAQACPPIAQFWPDWKLIAAVPAIFLLGQTISDYALSPYLVGRRINLHPVWSIFALFAFGNLFGLVGLLIDTAIRTLGRKFLPWSLALSK